MRRALAIGLLLLLPVLGAAKPKPKGSPEAGEEKAGAVRTFRFDDLDVEGNVKAPQLMYFLKRIRNRFQSFRLPPPDFVKRVIDTQDADFL